MNLLENLIEFYETHEEANAEIAFNTVIQSRMEQYGLSKEDSVNLKRQFINYIDYSDQLNSFEELQEYRNTPKAPLNNEPYLDEIVYYAANRPKSRPHKKFVEAFINNVSVPKTLEELDNYFLDGNDAQVLVSDTLETGTTRWSVPRWAKRGDIVLFMHAKNARSSLTRLRTETQSEPHTMTTEDLHTKRLHAIAEQLDFHKQFGGKIYAIGRVNGKPEIETIDPGLHYRAKVFCDIDDLFLLQTPVDLSEFNSFIELNKMGQ